MFAFMIHVQANAFISYNNYTVSACYTQALSGFETSGD